MSHWYGTDGQLLPPQALKNGNGYRDANLGDARKVLAVPSVTTIIGDILAKPGLERWKYEQIIVATDKWTTANSMGEAVMAQPEILTAAFSIADLAADFGTQVHAGISARLLGQEFFCTDIRVVQCVNGFFKWHITSGQEIVLGEPERTFVNNQWGFAGTIDNDGWYHDNEAILDFKTQDATTLSDFNLYDPEYPLQLAGYALGTDNIDHKRVSVLISRTTPGLVKLHEWKDNDRYNVMWICLLGLWQAKNNYYPGKQPWASLMQEVLKGWV